jgi:cytidylate kinase
MKKVIAIDGPSGSGKTTIAKRIAQELGLGYLDTGALYRAVAIALRKDKIETDESDDGLNAILRRTVVSFHNGKIFLNGKDVSEDVRSKEIDHYSSVFSARKIVRDFLLDVQRNAAYQNNIVVEGRDTTTVVFPNASKKIFLDASVEERAKRRFHQYKEKGVDLSLDEAKQTILERDTRDSSRNIAPLSKAPDAFMVDSSRLTVDEVTKQIIDFIQRDVS